MHKTNVALRWKRIRRMQEGSKLPAAARVTIAKKQFMSRNANGGAQETVPAE